MTLTTLVRRWHRLPVLMTFIAASAVCASAARQQGPVAVVNSPVPAAESAAAATVPAAAPEYVIGTDDVLSISFWGEKDLTAEVTVRPDGKVTLPLLNDVMASGRTPEQLRDAIRDAARAYLEDPTPTVIVKEIKSRRVYITGQVEKPGPYQLNGQLSVLQLIAVAGGLKEFADGKRITVMRNQDGRVVALPFNYQDVIRRRNLAQNVDLKPGDTVVVP
jgi:polysaccharide export outer membrane protein